MSARTPRPSEEPKQEIFDASEKRLVADYVRSLGMVVNEDALTDKEMVNLCDEIALNSPHGQDDYKEIEAIVAKAEEVKSAILCGLNNSPLAEPEIGDNENVYSYISKFDQARRQYPVSVRMEAVVRELEHFYGKKAVRSLDPADPNDYNSLQLCERLLSVRIFIDAHPLPVQAGQSPRIAVQDNETSLLNRAFRSMYSYETRLRDTGVIGRVDEIGLQQMMLDIARRTGNVGEA